MKYCWKGRWRKSAWETVGLADIAAILVLSAHPQRGQRACIVELDGQLHRTAAHLAVIHVLALSRRHVDTHVEPLAAPRTLDGDEAFRVDGPVRGARFEHRLQPVQLIDVLILAAADPPAQ